MNRQRDAAVATAELMATLATEQVRCVAAAIDEDDGLLARAERLLQRRFQRLTEDDQATIFFLGLLLSQIDHFHFRKRTCFDAMRHPQQRVFAARGVLAALQRWRRRSKNYGDAAHLRANHSEITRVVSRGLLLFVRAVALLVDHNHAESLKRSEQRR